MSEKRKGGTPPQQGKQHEIKNVQPLQKPSYGNSVSPAQRPTQEQKPPPKK